MYCNYSEMYFSELGRNPDILDNGETETIEMKGKRSMKIYEEVMSAIRAVDLSNEFSVAKEKAEILAKPYSKWM
jgi:hypothetical protein